MARTQEVAVTAVTTGDAYSVVVPINWNQVNSGLIVGVYPASGASATWTVEATLDNIEIIDAAAVKWYQPSALTSKTGSLLYYDMAFSPKALRLKIANGPGNSGVVTLQVLDRAYS